MTADSPSALESIRVKLIEKLQQLTKDLDGPKVDFRLKGHEMRALLRALGQVHTQLRFDAKHKLAGIATAKRAEEERSREIEGMAMPPDVLRLLEQG